MGEGCAQICDEKQRSLGGIPGLWSVVSAKAFYTGQRKKMRKERMLSFLVCKTFCFPIRLCLLAKYEPSKLHSPNNPNSLPYFLSAAFGICYLSSCCQAGWTDLSWVLAVKWGLGYKGPILSVIQWRQVNACFIHLQASSPTPYHMEPIKVRDQPHSCKQGNSLWLLSSLLLFNLWCHSGFYSFVSYF